MFVRLCAEMQANGRMHAAVGRIAARILLDDSARPWTPPEDNDTLQYSGAVYQGTSGAGVFYEKKRQSPAWQGMCAAQSSARIPGGDSPSLVLLVERKVDEQGGADQNLLQVLARRE